VRDPIHRETSLEIGHALRRGQFLSSARNEAILRIDHAEIAVRRGGLLPFHHVACDARERAGHLHPDRPLSRRDLHDFHRSALHRLRQRHLRRWNVELQRLQPHRSLHLSPHLHQRGRFAVHGLRGGNLPGGRRGGHLSGLQRGGALLVQPDLHQRGQFDLQRLRDRLLSERRRLHRLHPDPRLCLACHLHQRGRFAVHQLLGGELPGGGPRGQLSGLQRRCALRVQPDLHQRGQLQL
jgi:hypothetical protein